MLLLCCNLSEGDMDTIESGKRALHRGEPMDRERRGNRFRQDSKHQEAQQ